MKIEKYKPNENEVIRFIKNDDEARLSASNNGDRGTEGNPYSLGEYLAMYFNNTWEGGFVENLGYVGKDQSKVSFPDYSSEFDWWSYFSGVFSFLPSSQIFPPDTSLPVSNSDDGHNGYDYSPRTEFITVMINGIFFDFRLCIINQTAITAVTARSPIQLYDGDFYMSNGEQKVYLKIRDYSNDGIYWKYNFQQMILNYRIGISICDISGNCVRI